MPPAARSMRTRLTEISQMLSPVEGVSVEAGAATVKVWVSVVTVSLTVRVCSPVRGFPDMPRQA